MENHFFIADRVSALLKSQNISEYQMSLELGMNKGYIQAIVKGRMLPSVNQLYNIADYFKMTLSEFFNIEEQEDSPAIREAIHLLRQMDESDAELLLAVMRRILRENR